MDIQTYPGLDNQIKEAITAMGNQNFFKLKTGYFLVKDNTPEAQKRKNDKVFFFPKEVDGTKFLVCRE